MGYGDGAFGGEEIMCCDLACSCAGDRSRKEVSTALSSSIGSQFGKQTDAAQSA
jgi:hypothetical protein